MPDCKHQAKLKILSSGSFGIGEHMNRAIAAIVHILAFMILTILYLLMMPGPA